MRRDVSAAVVKKRKLMKRIVPVLLAALLLTGLLSGCSTSKETEISVFAAASLTETLQTIKEAYEKEHPGVTIVYTFDLSRAVIIDSTHIQALDWGLMLEVPPIRDAADYVGIRAQDIAEGTGINTVSCRVCAQRENAFSRTVTLRPESVDSAAPLIWELPKYKWRQTETVSVALPPEKILLLKG